MTNDECAPFFAPFNITKMTNMICAKDIDKNICKGDSGGPLAHYDHTNNHWMLIGVVSFLHPNAVLNAISCNITEPSVFARVTAQLEWIEAHMSGQTCPSPSY